MPWAWRWPAGVAACFAAMGMYTAFAYFTDPSRAVPVPLTEWEKSIPLMPWTAWVYWSGLVYVPLAWHLNRDRVAMNLHIYSLGATMLGAAATFAVWPTAYPWDQYPIPADASPWSLPAMNLIRAVDQPLNCCPSLHVAVATLLALGFWADRRHRYHPWLTIGATLWSAALAASTLTTKQHSLLDVASGFLLGVCAFWAVHIQRPRPMG